MSPLVESLARMATAMHMHGAPAVAWHASADLADVIATLPETQPCWAADGTPTHALLGCVISYRAELPPDTIYGVPEGPC